jgi:hypothetical protein
VKIYLRPRQGGKTHELIKLAAAEELVIVCPGHEMARYVSEEARDMGLKIPDPVTWHDFASSRWRRGRPLWPSR